MAIVNGVIRYVVILLCSVRLSMQIRLDLWELVALLLDVLHLNTELPFHFFIPLNQHLSRLFYFQHAVMVSSSMWSWVNVSCS